MRQIIAMHGWASDSNSWDLWRDYFQAKKWHWQNGERGYGHLLPQSPSWKLDFDLKVHKRRVVISHSLGPHLLNKRVLKNATDVVLLGSFSRFLPEGLANRSLITGLKGMKQQLGTSQEKLMLKSFLTKACYPEKVTSVTSGPILEGLSFEGRYRLKDDLNLLSQASDLVSKISTKAKVLVVDGQQDAIVINAAKSDLLEDLLDHLQSPPTHWNFSNAGHTLLVPDLIEKVHYWLELSQ